MSKARRHHIVPQSHLQRFADENGRVCVRERDAVERSFVANVTKVSVERDFYAVEYENGWSDEVEKLLSWIETQGSAAIERVIAGTFPPTQDDRIRIAYYVTLQWLRGRDHREGWRDVEAKLKKFDMMNLPRKTVREGLEVIEGRPPTEREVEELIEYFSDPSNFDFKAHQNSAIVTMLKGLPGLTNILLHRTWFLLWAPEGSNLLTSDAPVTLYARSENHSPFGGVGYGGADEICFAISRRLGLLFVWDSRAVEWRREIEPKLATELNRRTATQAVRWIMHHPKDDPLAEVGRLPESSPKWQFTLPMRRIVG